MKTRKNAQEKIPWLALSLICAAAVAANLLSTYFSDSIKEFCPALQSRMWPLVLGAACFAVFLLVSAAIYRKRRDFFPFHELHSWTPPEPRKVLVLFVSPQSPSKLYNPNVTGLTLPPRSPDKLPVTVSWDLPADVAAFNANGTAWNWAPILRGTQIHMERLERVHLIPSPESLADCEDLEHLLKRYLPGIEVVRGTQPVPFEDFHSLTNVLKRLLHEETKWGTPRSEVIIDVTGGQKPTSIAGASMTLLTHELVFQYVCTNSPFQVIEYNIIQVSSPNSS